MSDHLQGASVLFVMSPLKSLMSVSILPYCNHINKSFFYELLGNSTKQAFAKKIGNEMTLCHTLFYKMYFNTYQICINIDRIHFSQVIMSFNSGYKSSFQQENWWQQMGGRM